MYVEKLYKINQINKRSEKNKQIMAHRLSGKRIIYIIALISLIGRSTQVSQIIHNNNIKTSTLQNDNDHSSQRKGNVCCSLFFTSEFLPRIANDFF